MSSLKGLVKTRTYRERSQPKARAKLGMLEKHKDYVQRARDFHRKEDELRKMQEKASFKNPDEFYFNMVNTKLQDGVHQKKAKAAPTEDELSRFTREDIGYLTMKQVSESKKVQRLRASLHDLDAPPKNKHTIFVDDDQQAASFRSSKDFARHLQTPVELLGRASHRPVSHGESSAAAAAAAAPAPAAQGRTKKEDKAKAKKYSELQQREQRESKLKSQLTKLRREKILQAKGVKRKVTAGDGQPRQFKFKQVRQR